MSVKRNDAAHLRVAPLSQGVKVALDSLCLIAPSRIVYKFDHRTKGEKFLGSAHGR